MKILNWWYPFLYGGIFIVLYHHKPPDFDKPYNTSLDKKQQKNPLFLTGFWTLLDCLGLCSGGDEGDRTPGLGVANAALSQLSYIPNLKIPIRKNVREHILLIVLVSRNC